MSNNIKIKFILIAVIRIYFAQYLSMAMEKKSFQ